MINDIESFYSLLIKWPKPLLKPDVVYFDQLLGAAHTQKLVETFFLAVFQPFLFISKLFQ